MDYGAGSDADEQITFGTDGWRATLDTFTEPRLRRVGQAVASYLDDEERPGPLVVGYDAREHSAGFADALAEVLAANGRDVTVASRDCPTPTVAWHAATGQYAGALMVTASHNPPEYNGVKFITDTGAPALPAVTDALEERLASPTTGPTEGRICEEPLHADYLDHVTSFVDADLTGLTVAYDALHGSGRKVTDIALERAGATVAGLRCDRDPTFGGVNPEPTPETVTAVAERIESGEADLGLVNDGDADRVAIVTPEHGYLDPNVVLAVIYQYLLEIASAGGDVVRTVSTSSLVDRVARAHGQTTHETPVGFKWVADAMGAHDALAGGEESGGYGVTAHLPNKDGIVVGLLACAAHTTRSLDDRIDALFEEFGEIHQGRRSVDCPEEHKQTVLEALEDEIGETFADTPIDNVSTVDGFKLMLADDTWVLVRPSGTEPKLRVYAEATSQARVDRLLDAGETLLAPHLTE